MFALGVGLIVIGGLTALVGSIIFIVAAFRVSTTWGLLVVFVPFAGLVFLFKYWDEAKLGFLISCAGFVPVLVATFLLPAALIGRGASQFQEAVEAPPPFTEQAEQRRFAEPQRAPKPAASPTAVMVLAPTPTPISTATPWPTIAPTPTPPPEDHDPIALAPGYVGRQLIVRVDRGDEFVGRLLEIDGDRLRFERKMATGLMTFSLPAERIRSLQPVD